MRIMGTIGTDGASLHPVADQAAGSQGFARLLDMGPPPAVRPTVVMGAGGLAALAGTLAIAGAEAPRPRRRRAIRRGQQMLGRLEALQQALLTSELPTGLVRSLRADLADSGESSGDAGLDRLIAEIELRTVVELAKLEC